MTDSKIFADTERHSPGRRAVQKCAPGKSMKNHTSTDCNERVASGYCSAQPIEVCAWNLPDDGGKVQSATPSSRKPTGMLTATTQARAHTPWVRRYVSAARDGSGPKDPAPHSHIDFTLQIDM